MEKWRSEEKAGGQLASWGACAVNSARTPSFYILSANPSCLELAETLQCGHTIDKDHNDDQRNDIPYIVVPNLEDRAL